MRSTGCDYTLGLGRDELVGLLRSARVPCAPVRDLPEVVADPHLHERGMLQDIEHPELGVVTLPHSPLRYEGVPAMPLRLSPELGQHNVQVFCEWLGLTPEELDELVAAGVV